MQNKQHAVSAGSHGSASEWLGAPLGAAANSRPLIEYFPAEKQKKMQSRA